MKTVRNTDVAIEFLDVVKTFPKQSGDKQFVLDHVNMKVPAGKTTVITGGSGQGKSVSLKLILKLMNFDSGKILVNGTDLSTIGRRKLTQYRTQFGVLFQGAALFDSLSVYENIALPLRERTELSHSEIDDKVMIALEQFELVGHEQKFPAQLSGGMKKRVGLARAMQLNPSIMLFDEPTTGLDPEMTQEIYQLFSETQKRYGFTSIIVSHDIPKVFNLADQVVILKNGKMNSFASSDDLQWAEQPHIQDLVKMTMGEIYQSSLVENNGK